MPKVMAVYMKTLLKMVPGTVSRTIVNNMDILDDLCMCVCMSVLSNFHVTARTSVSYHTTP
jgi:hypothetical protein